MNTANVIDFASLFNTVETETCEDTAPQILETTAQDRAFEISQNAIAKAKQRSNELELPYIEKLNLNSSEYGQIDNIKGLFVKGKCINTVSPDFGIVQPVDVYDSFQNVAKTHGMEINTKLSNYDNGGMLLSSQFDEVKIAGENHNVNLVFYTAHNGRYRTVLCLDILRVACFNQVPMLFKNRRWIFNEKHYKNHFNIQEFEQILMGIPESVEAYNQQVEALKIKTMGVKNFIDWYVDFYKVDTIKDSKRTDTKLEQMKEIYSNARGQSEAGKDNAWRAFNAITYYNTHCLPKSIYREENKLFKKGDDSLKALESLLAA